MKRKRKKKFQNRRHHKSGPERHDWTDPAAKKKKKRKRGGKALANKFKAPPKKPPPAPKPRPKPAPEPEPELEPEVEIPTNKCINCESEDLYAKWPDPLCLEHWAEWSALSQFWRPQEEVKQGIIDRITRERAEKALREED